LTDGTHHSPPNSNFGEFPYVTAKNIKNHGIEISNLTYVTKELHNEIFSRCNPEHGDLLYIKDGATTGIVAINQLREEFSMLSSVALLKLTGAIDNRYLLWTLRSPFFYNQIRAAMKGAAITRVNLTELAQTWIPLPPLAEQKRIVAKVDELMGLCDELEAQQQERELRKSVLVRSSLSRFAESPTKENLGYLFHNSYDIPPSELRKSILTLAVQGKLVPQDPEDEPAAEIEMQIAKRMSAIRNQRYHAFTATEDQTDPPFSIPHNWKWMPFGTLGEFLGGGTPSKDNPAYWNGEIPWVSPKDMKRPYIYDSIDHVTPLGADASSGRLIPTGALLMVVRGMILAHTFPVAITKREVTINQDMKALRLTVPEIGEYLLRCCTALSGAMLSNVERSSHGTCRIPTDALSRFLVPIPPLAEQHRIVAKVDQLMALVDELERQQAASREKASNLIDAIVHEMTIGG
jgi:type I restriction enzyme S subunit